MSLDKLRSELTAIDRQLVELVAERQRVVARIGMEKLTTARATRDYEREKEVLSLARRQAESLDVDPDLAESIMRSLIRASLASQEKERVAAEGKGDGRRVLVIGGAGKMGGWFVDFFKSQGFATTIADASVETGEDRYADWESAGLDYDVIVVATPLEVSGEILLALAGKKPRGLVFDIGSLKTPLKRGLEALRDAGCKVASLHPMFGPDTDLLSGRHLIFVDAGCPEATVMAREMFASTMVEPLEMNLEDHDRLIAYVLGLSHALNIAFFTALAESGEAAPKLARLSSTTFDSQLLVASAVARENPRLYFEIQHLNEFGLAPLDALGEAVRRLRRLVADGDRDGFVDLMEAGRRYLATRR